MNTPGSRARISNREAAVPLTDRAAWDARHSREAGSRTVPRPGTRSLDHELTRFFNRHLARRRGGTILEVGCGASIWLPVFSRQFGMTAAGIDYSDEGLAACRRNLTATGTSADLVRGDLLDPGFRFDQKFDVVYSLGVLEHFANPPAVVERMAGFLRPGGLFLAWIPNPAGAATRISRRIDASYDRTHNPASREEWVAWVRGAGLTVREVYPAQFLDFSHIHALGWPHPVQKTIGLAFRGLSLPFLWFERAFGVRIGIGFLCSGLFLAAERVLPGDPTDRRTG
jgi:SAM-dependent methyltransferase